MEENDGTSGERRDRGAAGRRWTGWSREGDAIAKEFKRGDFKGSVDFVNRITPVAEEMNHHPDLAISWDTVTVTITHPLRGRADRGRLRARRQASMRCGG